MDMDAFHGTTISYSDNTVEEPNLDAKQFYDMLYAVNQLIYDGCWERLSKLSLAAKMMKVKKENYLPENCIDAWA